MDQDFHRNPPEIKLTLGFDKTSVSGGRWMAAIELTAKATLLVPELDSDW
jgi:hypothetical protein